MKKTVALLFLLLITCIFYTGKVNAQESVGGLTVSPLTFELTANPGDSVVNKIKVYNPSKSQVSVKMEAEDFMPIGEEGKVVTTSEEDEDSTYSLRKWIKIVPQEFTLEPDEQKIVDFVIEVPKNAEPGGKYGSILAGISGSVGDGASTAVSQKTGALVLLMVSGDLEENLTIEEFSVPSFQEYGPIPFTLRFKNEGTVHVRPKGYIIITDMLGRKVSEMEFDQKNVIPDSIRKVETEWDTKWLFGKYTASVMGVYGTSNKNLESMSTSFWVIPWKVLGIALSIIAFFFIVLFITRKRLRLAAKILFKGEK